MAAEDDDARAAHGFRPLQRGEQRRQHLGGDRAVEQGDDEEDGRTDRRLDPAGEVEQHRWRGAGGGGEQRPPDEAEPGHGGRLAPVQRDEQADREQRLGRHARDRGTLRPEGGYEGQTEHDHGTEREGVPDRDASLPPQRDEPERPGLGEEDGHERERLDAQERRSVRVLVTRDQLDCRAGEHHDEQHLEQRDHERDLGQPLEAVAEPLAILRARDREHRQRDREDHDREADEQLEHSERGGEKAGVAVVLEQRDEDHEQAEVDDVHRHRGGERQRFADQGASLGPVERGPRQPRPDDRQRHGEHDRADHELNAEVRQQRGAERGEQADQDARQRLREDVEDGDGPHAQIDA